MLQEMQDKHEEENREREDRHAEEIRVRIRIQEDSERELNEQIEKQRQTKDQIINDLKMKIGEIKTTYKTEIDSLTITISTLEKQILI